MAERQGAGDSATGMTFRPVGYGDAWLLLEWRNHEGTRAHSFTTDPIPEVEHFRWLHGQLRDPEVSGWIMEVRGTPVGIAWYRRGQGGVAEVSVMVAPEHQGQGYGTVLLRETAGLATGRMGLRRIRALVMTENVSSVKAFEHAGYRRAGPPCWLMEREIA